MSATVLSSESETLAVEPVTRELDVGLAKLFVFALVCALFFTPNAQIAQSRVLVSATLAGFLLCLVPRRLSRTTLMFLFVSIAASAQILTSVMVNLGPYQDLAHAVLMSCRPIYFALLYLAGYMCISKSALTTDSVEVRRLLTFAASFFIVAQLLVASMQAFGIAGVFDAIYAQDKTRDATSLMRATGTIGNPNALAFYALQCFLLVLLLGEFGRLWKGFVLTCGALLIALTGSRSVLLVFLLCLALFVFLQRRSLGGWIAYGVIAVMAFAATYLVVSMYAEYFRYLAQLQILLDSTDAPLRKISSMAARFRHWDASLALFNDYPGVKKYFFGLGDRFEYSVLDNDYLYVSLRHGLTGIVLFFGMYLVIASGYLSRSIESSTRFFGLLVLFATGILSFAADLFSGWQTMAFFIFASGCLSASQPSLRSLLRSQAAESRHAP
jgi:hypothetical protein